MFKSIIDYFWPSSGEETYEQRQQRQIAELKKFSPEKMQGCTNVLVAGKKKSGKTKLMQHLIDVRKLNKGLIIGIVSEYGHYNNDFDVMNRYTDTVVGGYMTKLKKNMTKPIDKQSIDLEDVKVGKEKVQVIKSWTKDHLQSTLVLDESVHVTKSWTKDKSLKEIFANGGNYYSNVFCALSNPAVIPKSYRYNIDYIFLFQEPEHVLENIYSRYVSNLISSYELFVAMHKSAVSKERGCLVIDLSDITKKRTEEEVLADEWLDHIYYYEVPNL